MFAEAFAIAAVLLFVFQKLTPPPKKEEKPKTPEERLGEALTAYLTAGITVRQNPPGDGGG